MIIFQKLHNWPPSVLTLPDAGGCSGDDRLIKTWTRGVGDGWIAPRASPQQVGNGVQAVHDRVHDLEEACVSVNSGKHDP